MRRLPAFTLSLDCEGLWGMADQPSVVHAGCLTEASLTDAYAFIAQVLERAQIRSTAAFVTCFAAPWDAVLALRNELDHAAELAPDWLRAPLAAIQSAHPSGWHGHQAYKLLASSGHEIGWHGATHLCLSDQVSPRSVDIEISILKTLAPEVGGMPRSVVFPRNVVGHLPALKACGMNVYRSCLPTPMGGRVGSVLREWHVLDVTSGARPSLYDGWWVLPPGAFLNWPSGPRRLVPPAITILRWRSLLRSAVQSGGDVHMWFHPHNLITAPSMRSVFEAIMQEVGALIRSGDITCLTMAELAAMSQHEHVAKASV